jgi:hypothetical protein
MIGFIKFSVVFMIEILNILALVAKCDVINVLTGYLRYYAIVNFDTFIFDGLNATAPFYNEVFRNQSLIIDRTSSLKNNWSGPNVTYVESLSKVNEVDRTQSEIGLNISGLTYSNRTANNLEKEKKGYKKRATSRSE